LSAAHPAPEPGTGETAFDHFNIVVADLERSVRFYETVLGLRRGFERLLEGAWLDAVTGLQGARARCVFLEAADSGVRLELLEYRSPTAAATALNSLPQVPGLRHLAFRVPDMDWFYEKARSHGVRFISEPVLVPFELPGGRKKRLCYFYDPDGVLLEAAEYA
jgi:glyoxylase I family protein